MVGIFKNKKAVTRRKTPPKTGFQQKINPKSNGKRYQRISTKTSGKVIGFGFIALAVFTFVSLLTYSWQYWSASRVSYYSSSALDIFPGMAGNLTGIMGTLVAGVIFTLFGTAGYLLPLMALQTGIRRLKGMSSQQKAPRWGMFGVLVLLSALFFILSGEDPTMGGIFGGLLAGVLSSFFNRAGAGLIISVILLISLMKMTNFSLFYLFSRWGAAIKEQLKKNTKKPPIVADLKKSSAEVFLKNEDTSHPGLPPLSLLKAPDPKDQEEVQRDLLIKANMLEERLKGFGVEGKVRGIHQGPVITRYEFELAPGIRVTRIINLADDLALCLKAGSLRIVAPVPGESVVGIEVPNEIRQIVYLREIIGSTEFRKQRSKLTLALGKDIGGRPFVADLTWMPHLLIAGATGSGKSVCLNAIICSLLFKATAEEVKFIFIDPKRLELGIYAGLPHLLRPIVTEPGEALETLNWVILEMERRYKLLASWGVRNLAQYNILLQRKAKREEKPLPYIVIMVDELADLMLVSSRRVEKPIVRIAQMARAVGIHMVVAIQRPSVNVITGLIKANFPARIAFRMASQIDSRIILDSKGAESLIGNGDMLFLTPGAIKPERIHGAFVGEEEIHNIITYLKKQKGLKLFKG